MLEPIHKLEGYTTVPMSSEQTQLLLILLQVPLSEILKNSPDAMETFAIQVAKRRLIAAQVEVDDQVLFIIADWSTSPGDIVMICHAVSHLYADIQRPVTLSDFVNIFPMGIPSKDSLGKFWDYQKGRNHNVGVDNMLDQMVPSVWPSIKPADMQS